MKKSPLVFLVLLPWALVGLLGGCADDDPVEPPEPCSVTVTAPAGAEILWLGNAATIRWQSTGTEATAVILLVQGNDIVGQIAPNTPNDGFHPWVVDDLGGGLGADYAFLVAAAGDSTCFGRGPAFRVAECAITLTEPATSVRVNKGDTLRLAWQSVDVATVVDLELIKGGEVIGPIALGQVHTGQVDWVVDSFNEGTSDFYQIRARDTAVDGCEDRSEFLRLVDEDICHIQVLAPAAYETVTVGQNLVIRWTMENASGSSHLDLYDTGGLVGRIATAVPGVQVTYDWTVDLMGASEPAMLYFIRVTDAANAQCWNSSQMFLIAQ